MRARDVVGRRIVRVEQSRFLNRNTDKSVTELRWLELDDGTVLSFYAGESHVTPFVMGVVHKPQLRKKRRGA